VTGIASRLRGVVRPLAADTRALGAVEFAMVAPFMILLYLGGYQLMDAISVYRKVVVTDRTLADLTTQDVSITTTEADAIIKGARQVMTPYSTANATLIITQVKIDHDGVPSVDWSRSNDGTQVESADLDVPTDIKVPDSYVILSQITYRYKPAIGGSLIGPMTFSDQIYMNPRRSNSIPCSDCT
jgi:Flp pilus assembly protein TadG